MTEKLQYILTDLNRLSEFQLQEIQSMVDRYPYNQNWRMLLSKKLSLLNKTTDIRPFSKAALYSIDNIKLHQILKGKQILPEDQVELEGNPQKETDNTSVQKNSENKTRKNKLTNKENEKTFSPEESKLKLNNEIKEFSEGLGLSNEDSVILPIHISKPTKKKTQKKKKDDKKRNAIVTKLKKKEKKRKKNKIEVFYIDDDNSIKEMENNLIKSNVEISEPSDNNQEKEMNFTEWLASLNSTPTASKTNIKETNVIYTENNKNKKESQQIASKKKKKKGKSKKNKEIISETLAIVLHKQGHNNKAIKMYDRLSLKYPKKSSYFAAQIEKIKESDNS